MYGSLYFKPDQSERLSGKRARPMPSVRLRQASECNLLTRARLKELK